MKYQCYHEEHIFDSSDIGSEDIAHDGTIKCPICGSYAEPLEDCEVDN